MSSFVPEGHTVPATTYAPVTGIVFGGGDEAAVTGSTRVIMQTANASAAKIFGGGNQAGVSVSTNVEIKGGIVDKNENATDNSGDVYGGCNEDGTVGPTTATTDVCSTVTISGGHIEGSVFGGGFGTDTKVNGKASVEIKGSGTQVDGDVFGGGNEGTVNGGTDVKIKSN
jgi:hypothetical protein